MYLCSQILRTNTYHYIMCGIVGYIGKRDAYPVLLKSLKRLEYRGYDSAGVALIDKKRRLNVYKTKGKVSDLESFVSPKDVSGTIGIAHTRWATHGEPCQANAHPHFSSSQNLALIHNGIIENYATLKEKLQKKGFLFTSSTNTEVLVQLIEYFRISNHLDLLTAVQLALHEVVGAYAIAVLDRNNPDEIERNCIKLSETLECPEPLIATISLQLLAYQVAICKRKHPFLRGRLHINSANGLEKEIFINQIRRENGTIKA